MLLYLVFVVTVLVFAGIVVLLWRLCKKHPENTGTGGIEMQEPSDPAVRQFRKYTPGAEVPVLGSGSTISLHADHADGDSGIGGSTRRNKRKSAKGRYR